MVEKWTDEDERRGLLILVLVWVKIQRDDRCLGKQYGVNGCMRWESG